MNALEKARAKRERKAARKVPTRYAQANTGDLATANRCIYWAEASERRANAEAVAQARKDAQQVRLARQRERESKRRAEER